MKKKKKIKAWAIFYKGKYITVRDVKPYYDIIASEKTNKFYEICKCEIIPCEITY